MRLDELLDRCVEPYDHTNLNSCPGWTLVPNDIKDELTILVTLLGYISITNSPGESYIGHHTPDHNAIPALSVASGSRGKLFVHSENLHAYMKSLETGEAHEPI
jgi:hypothetical protein